MTKIFLSKVSVPTHSWRRRGELHRQEEERTEANKCSYMYQDTVCVCVRARREIKLFMRINAFIPFLEIIMKTLTFGMSVASFQR